MPRKPKTHLIAQGTWDYVCRALAEELDEDAPAYWIASKSRSIGESMLVALDYTLDPDAPDVVEVVKAKWLKLAESIRDATEYTPDEWAEKLTECRV